MNYQKFLQQVIYLIPIVPLLACCSGVHAESSTVSASVKRDYWPTTAWKESIPEKQGMDSQRLSELPQHIEEKLAHIRSFLIVRHGYLVFEKYYQGCEQNDYHEVASVTKSFTSALVGIALKGEYLKSLDQKMMDFFPDYATSDIVNITLGHLLTMTSGFRWNDINFPRWTRSDNWIKFAVERPIVNEPGEKFNYDTPAAHLLSGILAKATGISTLKFASKYLFEPLGIAQPQWSTDPQGYNTGGHGAAFRSRDLAKFGYLYLNNGMWDGKQVISSNFVQTSTQKQNEGGFPENEHYGYLWWVTTVEGHHAYFAGGFGGQFIYIVPELDLVVVITSNLDRPHMENRNIVGEFIIPAILE